jgi:hypothetical protein
MPNEALIFFESYKGMPSSKIKAEWHSIKEL